MCFTTCQACIKPKMCTESLRFGNRLNSKLDSEVMNSNSSLALNFFEPLTCLKITNLVHCVVFS